MSTQSQHIDRTAIRLKATRRVEGMNTGVYSSSEVIGYLEGQVSVLVEINDAESTLLAHSLSEILWEIKKGVAA